MVLTRVILHYSCKAVRLTIEGNHLLSWRLLKAQYLFKTSEKVCKVASSDCTSIIYYAVYSTSSDVALDSRLTPRMLQCRPNVCYPFLFAYFRAQRYNIAKRNAGANDWKVTSYSTKVWNDREKVVEEGKRKRKPALAKKIKGKETNSCWGAWRSQ